jgi:hypothetical protein
VAYRLGELTVDDPEAGTVTLQGDGFAAAGEIVTLLTSPQVQRYLQMSPEEAAQAAALANAYRERLNRMYAGGEWRAPHLDPRARPARQELESRAAALLGPDRMERLKRLSWRIRPGDALLDDDVAAAVGLTAEQRQELVRFAEANEGAHQAVLGEIRAVRLRSHDALEARGREVDEEAQQRLLARLTAEQRQRFDRLRQARQ